MLAIYDLPNPRDYLSGLKRMISFRAKFTHNRKKLVSSQIRNLRLMRLNFLEFALQIRWDFRLNNNYNELCANC